MIRHIGIRELAIVLRGSGEGPLEEGREVLGLQGIRR